MAGRADVNVAPPPHQFPRLNRERPQGYFLLADYGLNLPGHGFFSTEEIINGKGDAFRSFVDVAVRAWEYARDHPEEAMRAMYNQRAQVNLPDFEGELAALENYRGYLDTERTRGRTIGWHSEEDWADAFRAMADAGVIKSSPRPTDYFTNQFVPNR
jgi:ABC-type nitrate/sulfonate/bicarbonate transport system substrate-binding protein